MKALLSWSYIAAFWAGALPLIAAPAQEPATLRLTRELRIDAAEHDLTAIYPPGGLTVAPNGTIVISQNQDGLLRYFDAQGRRLGTFGKKGQGPGEFENITRFLWIGDTLVVGDGTTRRFTLVSPDQKLVRTVPYLPNVSKPVQSNSTAPAVRAGTPRLLHADYSQSVAVSFAEPAPIPDWLGKPARGMLFLQADSTGAFKRVTGWVPNATQCNVTVQTGPGSSFGMRIPFCTVPLDEPSMRGDRLALAYLEEGARPSYRVMVMRANGDTVFSRSYSYQRISIPKADKDTAIAARVRGSVTQRTLAENMQLPEFFPPFTRLLVGLDETTWLELAPAREQRTWQMLDAGGVVAGVITVPRNATILAASRDRIWAIERDDDGLQHVVRFRVSR
jgi:hypothetical protein